MHEISLVRGIFKTLEAEFVKEELDRLQGITLKVGLLSNVEPLLMQTAFSAVTESENKYTDVKLEVDVVPIVVKCEACGHKSTIKNYAFICEACHTPTKNVITGTELSIHQVHFSD